jgi:hypothetical protein
MTAEAFQQAREQIAGLKKGTDDAGKSGETFSQKFLGAKNVTGLFDDQVQRLVAGFTIASLLEKATGAAFDWTKELFAGASALVKQSERTGVSIEMLERWQVVARRSNVDAGLFADGAYRLGLTMESIARGGGKEAEAALTELGLSYDDLKSKSPEQRLDMVIRALGGLTSESERNYLATALLTKGVADGLSPTMQKYGDILASTTVQSAEQVKVLNRYAEEFDRLTERAENWFKNGIAWQALRLQLVAYVREHDELREKTNALIAGGMDLSEVYAEITAKQMTHDVVLTSVKKHQRDYTDELRLARDEVKGFLPETKAQIDAALRVGESEEKIAEQYGISKAALKLYKDQVQESKKAQQDASAEAKKFQEALEAVNASTVGVTDAQRDSILAKNNGIATEAQIALVTGLTEQQVRLVIAAEKVRADAAKQHAKVQQEAAKQALTDAKSNAAIFQQLADQRAQKLVELVALDESTGQRLQQQRAAAFGDQIVQINQSEEAELRSLATKYDANTVYYRDAENNIKLFYQHERDLAIGTASTIEERMAKQGVFTKAQLDKTSDDLRRDYEQMASSGRYSIEQLEAAWKRYQESVESGNKHTFQSFLTGFDHVLDGAQAFASGVGGQFGDVAGKAIGVAKNVTSMASSFAEGDWIRGTIKALGLLGAAVGAVKGAFSNETKGGREDFAKSMGLSLDGLMSKLQGMGAEGQRLANTALNVIGKHDEAANRAWMAEVSKFFDTAEQQQQDLAAAATAAAEKFKTAQDGIGSALGTVITGTITTQDEFDRLSRIALNTFSTLVKSGVAPVDAMKQIGGSVDVLIASLETSGLTGSAAYNQLARWRTLTEANAPLLDQVSGLNSLMEMTSTLGGLNAETFADMQAQGLDAYGSLLAAGYTEAEARAQLKPLLEQEIKLNREKGYAIDDATQKIIAQGIANGDLSDSSESMTDVFREGISALILAIGGELPDAWKKATKAAEDESKKAADKVRQGFTDPAVAAAGDVRAAMSGIFTDFRDGFTVPIDFDINRPGGGVAATTDWTGPAYASGGLARGRQTALLAEGGRPEIVGDESFMARALTAALDRLGMGRGPSGGGNAASVNIYVERDGSVSTMSDSEFARKMNRALSGNLVQVPATALTAR